MKSKYLKSKGKHRAEESQKSPDTFNYADAREFLEDVEGETAQLIKNNRFTRLKQGLDRESKALEKAIDDETITASSIKSRLDSLKEKARIISENERIVHAARIAVTDFLNPLIHGNFEFIAFEYPIEDMLLNPALARWAETSAKGFPVGERIGATFLPMDHHSAFSGPAVLRGYFYSPGEEGLRRFGIPLIYNPAAGREAGEFGRRMLKENFAVMRDEKWIHSVMANRAEIAFKYYVGLIKELSNYAQTFQKNFNALTPRKILARQRRLPKEAEKTDRPYDLQIGRGKYLPIQEQEFNSLWAVRGDWESPVFRHSGNETASYLYSTNRKKALNWANIPIREVVHPNTLEAIANNGFEQGVFFTSDGNIFRGDMADLVNLIFIYATCNNVPPDKNTRNAMTYIGKQRYGRHSRKAVPRDWGFEYLDGLEGCSQKEILGINAEGCCFIAYHFPDKNAVVVEPSLKPAATYVFDGDRFKTLRHVDIQTLRKMKPDGFRGKVDHREEEQRKYRWSEGVSGLINQ